MRKLKLDELGRISTEEFKEAEKHPLIVVADNIRSMHNVGSLFRSGDAFLVEKIYLCGYTPRPPHREITKTAIGAENTVDWEYREDAIALAQELKENGYQIAALEQTDGSVLLGDFHPKPTEKWALVLGNEVEGVQAEIIAICDVALEIPQFGTKHSLNVSVAGGIAMYSFVNG